MRGKIKLLLTVTQSVFQGAQRYVYHIATGLPQNKYEVTVVCGAGGALIGKLKEANIRVVSLPSLVREVHPVKDLAAFGQLWALMRRERYHIVHGNSSKAGILSRLAGQMARVPVVMLTAHGLVFNEPGGLVKRLLFGGLEWFSGLFTDMVITVCENDRRFVVEHGLLPERKVRAIHIGLDAHWFATEAGQRVMEGWADRPVVGCVANFYRTKGLTFLVQAAAQVVKAKPGTRFVLVGDGQERGEIEALISGLGLREDFLLLGERSDVYALLPSFDIFVLPSLKEGLPFALLEAMAAGRPVVATRVGGVPEAVVSGETGILVPPGDPRALGQAILTLLQQPEAAKRMGQLGRERAYSFTLDRMVESTERAYEETLKKKLGLQGYQVARSGGEFGQI